MNVGQPEVLTAVDRLIVSAALERIPLEERRRVWRRAWCRIRLEVEIGLPMATPVWSGYDLGRPVGLMGLLE